MSRRPGLRSAIRHAALPTAAIVAAVGPWPPPVVERFYSAGVYPVVQQRLTASSNLAPWAWLDAVAVLGLAAFAWTAIRRWRRRVGALEWAGRVALSSVNAGSLLYLAFLAAWGLNYQRVPAERRLAVDHRRITPERLSALGSHAVSEVNRLFSPAREAEDAYADEVRMLAPAFERAIAMTGTHWHVEPGRPKTSIIARAFPLAAVDGMVNPFGLEVILNPEVLPFERPFVLAHEWGHLAGYADESEASFAAFVTCLNGPAASRYSGWLALLAHVLRAVPELERRALVERLAAGPRADLRAASARLRRALPVVHAVSWRVYDRYLRANRVEAGIESYDQVTRLVLGAAATAALAAAGDPQVPRTWAPPADSDRPPR